MNRKDHRATERILQEKHRRLLDVLVPIANNNIGKDGREILARAEIVFALWQDEKEPDGVGLLLIKGQHKLSDVIAGGQARNLTCEAIPLLCVQEAMAAREVFGDKSN